MSKDRHQRAKESVDSLHACIDGLITTLHEQTKSTLEVHKGILTGGENYGGSQMLRDLVAEAIGWYTAAWYPARHLMSGKGSKSGS